MKKLIGILLAVMMMAVFACAALADDVLQPEAGKKFENDWAIPSGLVQIFYEEEGYRVSVEMVKPDATGAIWEYACFYHADTDNLVSFRSSRTNYTVNLEIGEKVIGDTVYDDMDEENQLTAFTIDADGFLIWKDGREDAGAGLKFANIGQFDGVWKNEAEETEAYFLWNGLTEDEMFYSVYITRGKTDGELYASFLMNGGYDPATGKLTAEGTCTVFKKNAEGGYDAEEDGETYDAVFSMIGGGRILFETANGIELVYDMMGHQE
ncbi:MAG: hypothetical protein IKH57_01850 [Clostridia bacterium]|nr:hypothetical protein [Clostridia bacterium]